MIRAATLERILVVLSDFVALSICFALAFWVQFHSGWIVDKFDPSKAFVDYAHMGLVLNVGWIFLFICAGLYRSWLLMSRTHQILRVLRAVLIGIVLIIVVLFGVEFISKIVANEPLSSGYLYGSRFPWIFIYGGFALFLVVLFRMVIYRCLRRLLSLGFGANNILVLGATEAGKKIAEALAKTPERGQRVVGFVDERFQVMEHEFANVPVLGKYSDLATLIKKYKVTGIIIAHDSSSPQEIMRVLVWVCDQPVHIYLVPELYSVINGQFKANLVYGFELQELFAFTMPLWQVRVKRVIDILFGAFLGIISFPVCVLAAIAIKLEDHGPVFYKQERLTLNGKTFQIIKFRSMRCDAEKDGVARLAEDHDDRITRVGAFIRKCRIDELPQIFNIFLGQMSMVGPRPERPEIAKEYEDEMPEFALRLQVKAGLTGYAQVYGKYNTTPYDKVQMDLIYVARQSIMEDIRLMLMTFKIMFVPSSTEGVSANQRTAQRTAGDKEKE